MSKIGKPRSSKGLATFCARIAQDKISHDVLMLDMSEIETAPAEYFVVCTCESTVQVQALINEVHKKCTLFGIDKPGREGPDVGNWVIMDFFDVVLHIMLPEIRSFYKLEKLWSDSKFMTVTDDGKTRSFKPENLHSIYNPPIEEII
ncbi:MAG: ribosome silencing factor [Candidatus Kapabacteria bacterium]|nr:ribosome silencing factor [Candidatus Kapabacteria bacterium]